VTDPFSTLGFEPVFDLDSALLERRHRELSRALHPDRYAGRPASERRDALGRAIEVNHAFRRLKDPVGRAEALLEHHGRAVGETGTPPADPSLLMDVMERREALGDARRKKDLGAVRELARSVVERERACVAALSSAFAVNPPDFARAESALGELRYHRRFLDEVGTIEDEMG
jgi:molecular chaperone HscB